MREGIRKGWGGEDRERESVCVCVCDKVVSDCLSPGVGRVFTWGYGSDGQLANNENKGRYTGVVFKPGETLAV